MIKPLKHLWSGSWTLEKIKALGISDEAFLAYMKKEKDDVEINGIGEIVSNYFYHYRAGSNWNGLSNLVVKRRADNLYEYFNAIKIFPPTNITLISKCDHVKEQYQYASYELLDIDLNINSIVLKEMVLLHERLNPSAYLIMDFNLDSSSLVRVYQEDEVNKYLKAEKGPVSILDTHPGDYRVENVLSEEVGRDRSDVHITSDTSSPEVWIVNPSKWCMIPSIPGDYTSGCIPLSATPLSFYAIEEQHHYQVVVLGRKLFNEIDVQLECVGDTFFGQLSAKNFSLESELTLIVWDFYNKFDTYIGIGFKITDNRNYRDMKNFNELCELKKAYLICLEELG